MTRRGRRAENQVQSRFGSLPPIKSRGTPIPSGALLASLLHLEYPASGFQNCTGPVWRFDWSFEGWVGGCRQRSEARQREILPRRGRAWPRLSSEYRRSRVTRQVTDTLTAAKRSWNMARIPSRNTRPELLLRSSLHALGFRFRLHRADLPGRPDLVLPRYRVAIFVHGCFWHGHSCKDGHRPASNQEYWIPKLERNKCRDKKNIRELKRTGWKPIVVWTCALKNCERVVARIAKQLKAVS